VEQPGREIPKRPELMRLFPGYYTLKKYPGSYENSNTGQLVRGMNMAIFKNACISIIVFLAIRRQCFTWTNLCFQNKG
jgi:hypothetical protein